MLNINVFRIRRRGCIVALDEIVHEDELIGGISLTIDTRINTFSLFFHFRRNLEIIFLWLDLLRLLWDIATIFADQKAKQQS